MSLLLLFLFFFFFFLTHTHTHARSGDRGNVRTGKQKGSPYYATGRKTCARSISGDGRRPRRVSGRKKWFFLFFIWSIDSSIERVIKKPTRRTVNRPRDATAAAAICLLCAFLFYPFPPHDTLRARVCVTLKFC